MQLALGALASLGLGGTAAAAGTAAGAVGAAAGGASALGALQGLATIVSVIGTIGGGIAKAQQSNQQAQEADLEAGQEQLAAGQRQNQMRRELLRVLGENDVAFAAGGTDTTQGIAAGARAAATSEANDQISIDREDDDFRRALLAARARNLRSAAGGQIGGALIGALGQGLGYGIDTLKRGG